MIGEPEKRNCASNYRVVHVSHHPVGAKAFLEPLVQNLIARGLESELWVEPQPGTRRFVEGLTVPSRDIHCQVSPSPLRNLSNFQAIVRSVRATRPTVLHCHQTRASLWPLIIGRILRVPVLVYHNHGLSYPAFVGVRRALLRELQRLLCRLAHHAWFVSVSTLDLARADGIISASAGLVPGPGSIVGINLRDYEPDDFGAGPRLSARAALGLSKSGSVFGFVGRPMLSKGFPQLLDAWQSAGLWRQDGQLICAGCAGADLEAAGVGREQAVKGLGYLENMRLFYQACDIVVLPSRSEGFPYSLLEASAAGRPTIGTRVPGIVDVILPEKTGLLVELDNLDELAQALRRLAAEPEERERLGTAGREWIRERFSRDQVLEAFWQHYRSHVLPADSSMKQ